MKRLKKRQRLALQALADLGGEATTRLITIRMGPDYSVNGVSQTLGYLHDDVSDIGGRGGERKWRLKETSPFKAQPPLSTITKDQPEPLGEIALET